MLCPHPNGMPFTGARRTRQHSRTRLFRASGALAGSASWLTTRLGDDVVCATLDGQNIVLLLADPSGTT